MTIQNMERRTFLTGVGALGASALVPPAALARDAQVDCALVTGLDMSGSMKAPALIRQLAGLRDALKNPLIQKRMKELGVCSFDLFGWSSTGTSAGPVLDLVRKHVIRPEHLQQDIVTIQDVIGAYMDSISFRGNPLGAGTDTAMAIAYGRGLILDSGVREGSVRALNIVTDDDMDRDGVDPKIVADKASQEGITVNSMVVGGNLAYAESHIRSGVWSFVIAQKDDEDVVRAWEQKLSRDLG